MLLSMLQVVFPIFATVGVGYGFGYIGLLTKQVGDNLSTFCITVLIPVLIFRTLATSDLAGLIPRLIKFDSRWGFHSGKSLNLWDY